MSDFESVAAVLGALSPGDVAEYVERLVFMVVSGNGDAHLKNWGVVYADRRTPRLGPAYDLVATVTRLPRDNLALALDGHRDFSQVSSRSFHGITSRVGASDAEADSWVREARDRALEAWLKEGPHLDFREKERRLLEQHMRRVPLCGEAFGRSAR